MSTNNTAVGREWAEREAELARDQRRALEGPWACTAADALPLVDIEGDIDAAEEINAAAEARWIELCGAENEARAVVAELPEEALGALDWFDLEPREIVAKDLAALRSGEHTIASLLEHCLDGADEDTADGWRSYVATLEGYIGETRHAASMGASR